VLRVAVAWEDEAALDAVIARAVARRGDG